MALKMGACCNANSNPDTTCVRGFHLTCHRCDATIRLLSGTHSFCLSCVLQNHQSAHFPQASRSFHTECAKPARSRSFTLHTQGPRTALGGSFARWRRKTAFFIPA